MHLVGSKPQRTSGCIWFAYVLLIVMNILDVVYTNTMLELDKTNEANPLMAFMFYNYGIGGIIISKGVFLLLLGLGIRYLPTLNPLYTRLFYVSVFIYFCLSLFHGYWFFQTVA